MSGSYSGEEKRAPVTDTSLLPPVQSLKWQVRGAGLGLGVSLMFLSCHDESMLPVAFRGFAIARLPLAKDINSSPSFSF